MFSQFVETSKFVGSEIQHQTLTMMEQTVQEYQLASQKYSEMYSDMYGSTGTPQEIEQQLNTVKKNT